MNLSDHYLSIVDTNAQVCSQGHSPRGGDGAQHVQYCWSRNEEAWLKALAATAQVAAHTSNVLHQLTIEFLAPPIVTADPLIVDLSVTLIDLIFVSAGHKAGLAEVSRKPNGRIRESGSHHFELLEDLEQRHDHARRQAQTFPDNVDLQLQQVMAWTWLSQAKHQLCDDTTSQRRTERFR